MPIRPIEYVDQPAFVPRHNVDTRTLGALYLRGGENLAEKIQRSGDIKAGVWSAMGQIFNQYQAEKYARNQQALGLAMEEASRAENLDFRNRQMAQQATLQREEIAARAAEREEARRIQEQTVGREAARWQADALSPGQEISPLMADTLAKFPGTAALVQQGQTLPAAVTPGAAGVVAPGERPYMRYEGTFEQKGQQAAQQRAEAQAEAARLRDAELAASRVRDDLRADEALQLQREQLGLERRRVAETERKGKEGDFEVTMPAPIRDVLDFAMSYAPPGRRKEELGAVERKWKAAQQSGNDEDLKAYIKTLAISNELADDKRQITGRISLQANLSKISKALDQLKANGVDTNLFTGKLEDLARWVGTTTKGDGEMVRLATQIGDAYIDYRRSLTGVAFGEREAKEYRALFPDFSNTLPVNKAVIDGLLNGLSTRDDAFWLRKLGPSGARMMGFAPKAIEAPPGPTEPAPNQSRGAGVIIAVDEHGNVHHAPAGTPIPKGWTVRQQ